MSVLFCLAAIAVVIVCWYSARSRVESPVLSCHLCDSVIAVWGLHVIAPCGSARVCTAFASIILCMPVALWLVVLRFVVVVVVGF
jgi:hypothetical protein